MFRPKTVVALVGGLVWLFVLGFVLFAAHVNRLPQSASKNADGIVVLTGGPARLEEAGRLFREGRAKRLLITGINPQTGRDSLEKLTTLSSETFACCVDLDYAALDTIGNAEQTGKWASNHGFTRVIVVTSRFHMPRSLVEIGRALPGAELIPHTVPVRPGRSTPWWLNARVTREIVSEYVKFLPSAARMLAARAAGTFDGQAVASQSPPLAKTSGL
jgi:uncharacterized SAM-binding protein YcdF (DUF218 family)